MNELLVNQTARKYRRIFSRREFDGTDEEPFHHRVIRDFEQAGFKYDDFRLFDRFYPDSDFEHTLHHAEEIESINDAQTVMNTIFSVFRYCCDTIGFDYTTPFVVKWFVAAFKHLAELTKEAEVK